MEKNFIPLLHTGVEAVKSKESGRTYLLQEPQILRVRLTKLRVSH